MTSGIYGNNGKKTCSGKKEREKNEDCDVVGCRVKGHFKFGSDAMYN